MSKHIKYAIKITEAIATLFDPENENYIDQDELSKGYNLTHFIHALGTIAPNQFYNRVTGDNINNLEFNHVANKLCFQYMDKKE